MEDLAGCAANGLSPDIDVNDVLDRTHGYLEECLRCVVNDFQDLVGLETKPPDIADESPSLALRHSQADLVDDQQRFPLDQYSFCNLGLSPATARCTGESYTERYRADAQASLMPPTPVDDPLQSPQESDSEQPISVPKSRHGKSPLDSVASIPYRRSNASLSSIFASTSSLPTRASGSPGGSGTVTPTAGSVNGSVFSPGGSTAIRSPSPAQLLQPAGSSGDTEARDLILRAFSPHVSILASQDTEELIRHKGIHGGLLELLRPFGERVQGKVTIRDSSGVSRSWEDYGVRFTGVRDGLENPRIVDRNSIDSVGGSKANSRRTSLQEYKPARFRSGGDVPQIEDVVERHLTFAEEQSGPIEDYLTHKEPQPSDSRTTSPFFTLYLRRLLSGLPMVPSENLSHPVASVIAISSRSPSPIEELRTLFHSSNQGEHRLPQWVHNEFLRYYVLIHDEDYDDITKSMALFDQMKRHFGLHCHLLRLRSTQCLPSDDGAIRLPHCEWTAAAEDIAEIVRRETSEDDEDPTPCIFESDANAIRAFVREMVTQSIVPSMERASATWNDQVASRRRGLSGRFMSLSKRFTTFSGRNSSVPSLAGSSSNYDSLQGFYRPDAPEAIMRKLADYGVMLRDYKLAYSTYEILCQDFKNDKAWRYYAGANEMAALSSVLVISGTSGKVRLDVLDQYLETAYYSYVTRAGAPYNALRTLILGAELLKLRGGSALDDAARWYIRAIDDRLVGPVGHVLLMERIASCSSDRKRVSSLGAGDRRRKAGFWGTMAADAWLRMEKTSQAEKCLDSAMTQYGVADNKVVLPEMLGFLQALQRSIQENRHGLRHIDGEDLLGDNEQVVEALQEASDQLQSHPSVVGHRKSVSGASRPQIPALQTDFAADPLGAIPSAYEEEGQGLGSALSPSGVEVAVAEVASPIGERRERRDDGFE